MTSKNDVLQLLDMNILLTSDDIQVNKYVSTFILIMSITSIFTQLLTIYLFLKKRELLKNTSYQIQMILEFLWMYGKNILPSSRYSQLTVNNVYRINICINTFIITLLISEIRKEIMCLLSCSSYKQSTSTTK
ncbi:Hypothetical protein SRAE_1000290400 [Strongyloides ratti]|uniref:Uncharacterized protein n=1 Tax=Strongyloides ratti TaxID=34506 RepID=A0A090L4D1_STRRB|nr:Hypothetical protein SRAE_1000290400 [Strongyloides ratti]CEF64651.1 Hypothetical protein SRAE_1000290400 [Strongyloides ratti]